MRKLNPQKRIEQVWATYRRFLTRWRRWVLAALMAALGVAVILVLIYAGYWVSWTGFSGYGNPKGEWQREKTLWDWMDLLFVPLVVALGAAVFTWLTNKREREAEGNHVKAAADAEEQRAKTDRGIALDRSRETALQTYLDRMTELIKEGLRESKEDDAKRSIARARTLTVLRQLDRERKGLLL